MVSFPEAGNVPVKCLQCAGAEGGEEWIPAARGLATDPPGLTHTAKGDDSARC